LLLITLVSTLITPTLSQAQMSSNDATTNEGDVIRLIAALDEPEFYCFDLTGYGDHLVLDDPIQAHTCKLQGGTDQKFAKIGDQIQVVGYDRCLQVAGSGNTVLTGSTIIVRECNGDNMQQKISLNAVGQLVVKDTDYCITAGPDSAPAFGPSHIWRSLSAVKCESADAELSTWQIGLD